MRRSSSFNTERIDHIFDKLHLHYGDVLDASGLTSLVFDVKPDQIYNLAAQSHVGVSFQQPAYSAEVAAIGALNVLEAAFQLNKTRRVCVYQASSSEMYGKVLETPQSETTPFNPVSPYACAKVFAHHMAESYRQRGLFVCCGILFNHESERRGETFVTRKIAKAAARIVFGLQDKLVLGNLRAKRDWGYAPDYVQAMYQMMQHKEPDTYVVATGDQWSVNDFLVQTFARVGLSIANHVEFDARYSRPVEVDTLLGNADKARQVLGWKPQTPFNQLVDKMLASEMEKLA